MFESLKMKKPLVYALVALVLAGAFLRFFNHSEWLHFEVDQSRDAIIVMSAIQGGPGEMPLQGPRAAGSFLRLGPGFYYLEYASALLFGSTPSGMAMFVAVFSTLAIIALYFLLARFFPVWISLGLTAIFTVSPFFVLYGRFAWNPNPLPLLVVFGMYALLRSVSAGEKRSTAWFSAAAFVLGLATHMHFLALLIIGISVPLFLLYKRPRFRARVWVLAVGILLVLYTPLILNDVLTGGENIEQFAQSVSGKTEESNHSFVEKVLRNWSEQATQYAMMLTGNEKIEFFSTRPREGFGFQILCDEKCWSRLWMGAVASASLLVSVFLLARAMRRETETIKKDFLVLIAIWCGSAFAIYTPIAFDIVPRFFLPLAPVPFVFLGLIALGITSLGARWKYVAMVMLVSVALSGTYFTFQRLSQLDRSRETIVKLPDGDKILRERTRVTFGQMEAIADYMVSKREMNGYPIFHHGEVFYKRAFGYILDVRGVHNASMKATQVYRQGNHFLIFRTDSDTEKKSEKYLAKYDLVEKKAFGTLTVLYFTPKAESITAEAYSFDRRPGDFSSAQENSPQKRYIWGELFDDADGAADES